METQETNVTKTQEQPVTPKEVVVPEVNEDGTPKVVEPKVEDVKIAKVVAQVKKKEQELTAKERKLADREAKTKGYENFKQMIEDDPLAAIESYGINKEKLFEKILKSGELPTVDEKIAKLEAELQAERDERAKDKQELEQQKADRAISEFKTKIKDYADTKKETELKVTTALGQTSAIYDVIEQNFTATGNIMTIEDAGKLVEDYFSEKGKTEYEKLKAIFEAKPETPQVDVEDEPEIVKPKTLTNKSTTIPTAEGNKFLSNEESKRRLAKKYADKLFS